MKRIGGGSLGDGSGNLISFIRRDPPKKKEEKKDDEKKEFGFCEDLKKLSQKQLDYLYNKLNKNTKGKEWKKVHNGLTDKTDADYNNDKIYCIKPATVFDENGYPKNIRLGKRQQQDEDDFKCSAKRPWPAGQLVLIYHGYEPDLSLYKKEDWEASHLCNHPFCVNLDHLVWEHRIYNARRKNCRIWTTCPCGCNHSFNPCTHNPKCIALKDCKCVKHINLN